MRQNRVHELEHGAETLLRSIGAIQRQLRRIQERMVFHLGVVLLIHGQAGNDDITNAIHHQGGNHILLWLLSEGSRPPLTRGTATLRERGRRSCRQQSGLRRLLVPSRSLGVRIVRVQGFNLEVWKTSHLRPFRGQPRLRLRVTPGHILPGSCEQGLPVLGEAALAHQLVVVVRIRRCRGLRRLHRHREDGAAVRGEHGLRGLDAEGQLPGERHREGILDLRGRRRPHLEVEGHLVLAVLLVFCLLVILLVRRGRRCLERVWRTLFLTHLQVDILPVLGLVVDLRFAVDRPGQAHLRGRVV
mmetsp:Transcript_89387/g.289079  ORF Transcript_89387/g.289079 Transcript_89387/m.289079 type:complete len:301 (+) Transcript_89387:1136-2038(+)